MSDPFAQKCLSVPSSNWTRTGNSIPPASLGGSSTLPLPNVSCLTFDPTGKNHVESIFCAFGLLFLAFLFLTGRNGCDCGAFRLLNVGLGMLSFLALVLDSPLESGRNDRWGVALFANRGLSSSIPCDEYGLEGFDDLRIGRDVLGFTCLGAKPWLLPADK